MFAKSWFHASMFAKRNKTPQQADDCFYPAKAFCKTKYSTMMTIVTFQKTITNGHLDEEKLSM